uniref:Uncharacterized protein n=1 Tax=Anguilla anguilla TaxID=7936 RepID=A0A0E9SVM5_ANGAN
MCIYDLFPRCLKTVVYCLFFGPVTKTRQSMLDVCTLGNKLSAFTRLTIIS